MKKILILANHSGGLYDFRGELPRRLLEAGHEVYISVPDETKTAELTAMGAQIIHTELDRRGVNPGRDLKLLGAYRKLLRDLRPDLVLTYTIKPNIYGGYLCRRMRIPYIVTITGLGSTFERGGALLQLIIRMYRAGLAGAEAVFFQNAENRQIFRDHQITGRKDVLVAGSGVDLERNQMESYPGHTDQTTDFLYVGRIMKEKGIDEYLEAARRLHEKYGSRVHVRTIGFSDENYDAALQEAQSKGYLEALPFDKNIHPYLTAADCIVLPSWHEGMSNTLMEASATGRPVLASNVSGCKEIVEDGVTGFLFEPRNADSLFQAMDRFVGVPLAERAKMGAAARSKMEREFDRHKVMDAYMQEINQLL